MENRSKVLNGWVRIPVSCVAEVNLGKTPKKSQYCNDGNNKIIKFRDVSYKGIKWNTSDKGFVIDEALSELRELKVDDVLITASAHASEHIGKKLTHVSSLPKGFKRVFYVGELLNIRANQRLLSPKFSFYFFLSREGYKAVQSHVKGVHLTSGEGRKIEIPLPPPREQYRIVAKIEELFSELDKGIENLKITRAQIKAYRQALLKHAFAGKLTAQWRAENRDKLETTAALLKRIQLERAQRYQQQLAEWEASGKQSSKPKAPKPLPPLTASELAELPELPEGWGCFLMGDVCLESILGKMLDKEKNRGELKPYLRNINVRWGKFALDDLLEMRFEESEYVRYGLENGDLVICEGGEPGRCAVWRKELGQDMQIQKALHRVRFTNSINSFFVQLYFELCASNRRLEKMFTGTTIKHLTGERLARMSIPICSIDEQAQILLALESKFSEIDQLDQTITTSLQQAEALRQSILKKAFSGQLVPQDPRDEPASVLLERIKAEKAGQTNIANAVKIGRTPKESRKKARA